MELAKDNVNELCLWNIMFMQIRKAELDMKYVININKQ